jgi:hypothetical protein
MAVSNRRFSRPVVAWLAIAPLVWILAALPARADSVWLLVDTGASTLSVMDGDSVRRRFGDISIGRGGTTRDKRSMDGRTPLGEFTIIAISRDTPFHLFVRLDYPTPEHARRALETGAISARQFRAVERAAQNRMLPPQQTVLGGYIGIHGIGKGSPEIHEQFNWTNGCIALTNTQMDELSHWLQVGMKVAVR